MRKFLRRLLYFSFLPFCFVAIITYLFLKRDVFADYGYHKNYPWIYRYQGLGDISAKQLLQSNVRYNSFIFGSSRTCGLYGCYLQKQIKGSLFFHFGNWVETVGGISAKMSLLDSMGYRLDNVIIYLDTDYSFSDDGECRSSDHYLVTRKNKYQYLFDHYRSFLPPELDLGKIRVLLGKGSHKDAPNFTTDPITNDYNHICSDSIIETYGNIKFDSIAIASQILKNVLYQRSATLKFKAKQINSKSERYLWLIKDLLNKHKSRYYVIITPLYDQMKFAKSDMESISKVFGNHVYDFSGINSITNNPYNYPDGSHFMPYISKLMMDSVLSGKMRN